MNFSFRYAYWSLIAVLLILACQSPSQSDQPILQEKVPALSPQDQTGILSAIDEQQSCWNEANIDCFMKFYWKSDSLTFTSKNGINQGWQATYDRYVRTYPDAATMGQLEFEILHLKPLSTTVAHMIGKWHLKREMGDIGGYFTLIWRKIDGEWVITSDHTS